MSGNVFGLLIDRMSFLSFSLSADLSSGTGKQGKKH